MDKPIKFIFTILLIILVAFLFIQVVGLTGKQNAGYSLKYITTYEILLGAALILLIGFGLFAEAAGKVVSDNPLIDIISVFDFDESQDFRLFNGEDTFIGLGLLVGILFTLFIGGTVAGLHTVWQPTASPLSMDASVIDPLSTGHQAALDTLGISREKEAWLSSAQPAVAEDINYNYFFPTILTVILIALPFLLGMEINKGTFVAFSTIACLITSGLYGAIVTGKISDPTGIMPSFSGSHSDVYTNVPSFYSAAAYSFMASWINLQVGYPISIPAHFINNWVITFAFYTTLSIGVLLANSNLFFLISFKRRGSQWTKKGYCFY